MPNEYFSFKQFTIRQDHCAMKVGTDGVLLGAWAHGMVCVDKSPLRILDIGTGTGLIAMMMAQRYTDAQITAIDIDKEACQQAQDNVNHSPFVQRISVLNVSVQDFVPDDNFHLIVSNPPYFTNSLKAPDLRRTMARHSDTLIYDELFKCVSLLLSNDGTFCVILPAEYLSKAEESAALSGLFLCEKIGIRTSKTKPAKRYLLSYCKDPSGYKDDEHTLQDEWYKELVHDFYKMLN